MKDDEHRQENQEATLSNETIEIKHKQHKFELLENFENGKNALLEKDLSIVRKRRLRRITRNINYVDNINSKVVETYENLQSIIQRVNNENLNSTLMSL